MTKFINTIETPFAENGLKSAIPDAPQESGLINRQEGFTLKYKTPINAGGAYIQMEDVNEIFHETQTAIKEVQDKTVLSVEGQIPDEAGNVALINVAKSVNGILPDESGNINQLSLTTNADNVYLKHEGRGLTWGNEDFSIEHGKITADESGMAFNISGSDSMNISKQCVGINTPSDVAYSLKVGGHVHVTGILSAREIKIQSGSAFNVRHLDGDPDGNMPYFKSLYLNHAYTDGKVIICQRGGYVSIGATDPVLPYVLTVGGYTSIQSIDAGLGVEGGYRFRGDTDTGMFSDRDGDLYFKKNGVRLDIPMMPKWETWRAALYSKQSNRVEMPAGGTWAFVIFSEHFEAVRHTTTGVVGGGTVIFISLPPQFINIYGAFCWRVA